MHNYSNCKEDDFFIRLKVKSVYASTEDIIKYISEKYSLMDTKFDSLSYGSSGGMVLRIANNSYEISDMEVDRIKMEHIDELINKIIVALNVELREVSIETLSNTLEDCIYTKGDKLVEALLMAKVLAEKIGGKAILELI